MLKFLKVVDRENDGRIDREDFENIFDQMEIAQEIFDNTEEY